MPKRHDSPRLFLDADGVLANFDEGARRLLGMTPRQYEAKHGRGAFWKRLAQAKNFYGTLPEMPDARLLFDGVKHLKPTILTGLPPAGWGARRRVQGAAAIRVEVRQRRSGAERCRQPWARRSADQPLVKEAVRGEIRQPVLAEVERAERDQHADERLDHVEAAVVGNLQAQMIELFV